MRNFIAVGHPEDLQLLTWLRLASELGSQTAFFKVTESPAVWRLQITDNQASPYIVDNAGKQFELKSDLNCWYFRGPSQANLQLLRSLQLLHSLLSQYAYPKGNYFIPLNSEGSIASKPLQLERLKLRSPSTRLISTLVGCETSIIKSISLERSTACRVRDLFTSEVKGTFTVPALIQEFCPGYNLKLHSYRARSGKTMDFCVGVKSSMADYRTDHDANYWAMSTSSELASMAERLHSLTGAIFLDADFIVNEGSVQFLEVNLGPAPAFFEANVYGSGSPYSLSVLKDWLDGTENEEYPDPKIP